MTMRFLKLGFRVSILVLGGLFLGTLPSADLERRVLIRNKMIEMVEGDIEKQSAQVMENLKQILLAAGSSLEKAVKVTVYLADMNDFAKMNSVYEKYFTQKPARSTVQAAKLPKNARIEIDVIAEK